MPRNPAKRSCGIRAISGANIFIGTLSFFFHIWSLVWSWKEPDRISNTGQAEAVVYLGMVIMILSSLILTIVSWNLFKCVGVISSKPESAIGYCRSWKRWVAFNLTFYIIALFILVLSSGKQVSKGVIQYYMTFLLIMIAFFIFGIYYVGKLVTEMESCDPFTPTANLNNASCFDNSSSGHGLADPEIVNISHR